MKINYKQIDESHLQYDPKEIGVREDYEVDLSDFIKDYPDRVKEKSEILWVSKNLFELKDRTLFALWCARQVEYLMKDQRSINVLAVTENFVFGKASRKDLAEAAEAAWEAEESSWKAIETEANAWEASESAARVAEVALSDKSERSTWSSRITDSQIDVLLQMIAKPNGEWYREIYPEQGTI